MEETVEIQGAQCLSLGDGKVQVRVVGRWVGHGRAPATRPMLVVEGDGRRHRFPALAQPRRPRLMGGADWSAAFTVPAWVASKLEGETSLRVGDLRIALPPGLFREAARRLTFGGPTKPAAGWADKTTTMTDDLERAVPLEPEPGRQRAPAPAPGAVDESASVIAALRAELERRAVSEARLRTELTAARAELQERDGPSEEIEVTHRELRRELDALAEAVGQRELLESRVLELAARGEDLDGELGRLRAQLATSEVACEAALSEVSALRAELDRQAAELAHARRPGGQPGLSEAQALLNEARALRQRITSQA